MLVTVSVRVGECQSVLVLVSVSLSVSVGEC